MMSSIFSSFDLMLSPHHHQSLGHIYGLIPPMALHAYYWPMYAPSPQSTFSNMITIISSSSNSFFLRGFQPLILSTFLLLLVLNVMGAMPMSITLTSHLLVTLSLALPVWLSMILVSLTYSLTLSCSHFLPPSSPPPIAPFLSIVETLSSFIRPITLSFRLGANISAGHLIFSMMTTFSSLHSPISPLLIIILLILLAVGYSMFESMICFIQAYVFTMLSIMYTNDHIPVLSPRP